MSQAFILKYHLYFILNSPMFNLTEEKDSDFWRAGAAGLGRCEWQLLGTSGRSQAHTAHAVWTQGTFPPAGCAASGRSFISSSPVSPTRCGGCDRHLSQKLGEKVRVFRRLCANSKPQSRQPGSQQQANPRGDTGQEALKLGERRAVARTARIGTAPRASAGLQAGERLAEAARASSPSQCPRCPAPPGLPPLWPQGRWLPDREGTSVSPGRHPDASPVRVWQGGQRPLLQPQVSGNHGRGPASPAFSFF